MEKRTLIYRACRAPTIPLPFGLRSTGHYYSPQDHLDTHKPRPFTQVFWVVSGKTGFTLNNMEMIVRAGELFYYLPEQPHIIRTVSQESEYRWFTLDGPLAVQTMTSFGWPQKPVRAGKCPEVLFERLAQEIKDISPAGQRIASATAFAILSRVKGSQRPTSMEGLSDMVARGVRIMGKRFTDPGLNVSVLAGELQVHRATLSRLFHQETGMTCISFLTSQRVQHALSLLRNTDLPVSQVAYQSGFSDADYFCKAVVKATGHNPTGFRKL